MVAIASVASVAAPQLSARVIPASLFGAITAAPPIALIRRLTPAILAGAIVSLGLGWL